jgi:hypothetical protein
MWLHYPHPETTHLSPHRSGGEGAARQPPDFVLVSLSGRPTTPLALGEISTEELGATLSYRPQMLCASPALGASDPTSSAQSDIAVTIDHHDGEVTPDVDGDLKSDFSAPRQPARDRTP